MKSIMKRDCDSKNYILTLSLHVTVKIRWTAAFCLYNIQLHFLSVLYILKCLIVWLLFLRLMSFSHYRIMKKTKLSQGSFPCIKSYQMFRGPLKERRSRAPESPATSIMVIGDGVFPYIVNVGAFSPSTRPGIDTILPWDFSGPPAINRHVLKAFLMKTFVRYYRNYVFLLNRVIF